MESCLAGGGETFRLGRNEFALLLPGRGERRALTAAEAALERIRALDSESIRVSIGLAVYPTHCHDRNGLFSGAGDALTEAMREGVDWVRLFQPA